MSRRRLRRHREPEDLELTAFINPMVVLVTFLLVNVVFTHSAVLNLDLPAPSNGTTSSPAEKLLLEITVRADRLEIGDRNRGQLAEIPNEGGQPNVTQLAAQLEQLKLRYPDQKNATVLLEADIPYERLVQVMDAVRSEPDPAAGRNARKELFPDVSIGDAPVVGTTSKVK